MVHFVEKNEAKNGLFDSPQRESAVELVVNRIKKLLLSGRLQAGDRLPNEIELAQSLSVGRNSVREGMKILEALGIVEIRRGYGTYVATEVEETMFDPLLFSLILARATPKKMIELREMLEDGVSRLIIRNADPDDIAAIRDQYETMRSLSEHADPEKRTACDLAFHRAMGRATKNELVEKIYSFVLQYFMPTIGSTHALPENRDSVLSLHREILESLEARDEGRTNSAIRASIDSWMRRAGTANN